MRSTWSQGERGGGLLSGRGTWAESERPAGRWQHGMVGASLPLFPCRQAVRTAWRGPLHLQQLVTARLLAPAPSCPEQVPSAPRQAPLRAEPCLPLLSGVTRPSLNGSEDARNSCLWPGSPVSERCIKRMGVSGAARLLLCWVRRAGCWPESTILPRAVTS